jgi:hypothetical protein
MTDGPPSFEAAVGWGCLRKIDFSIICILCLWGSLVLQCVQISVRLFIGVNIPLMSVLQGDMPSPPKKLKVVKLQARVKVLEDQLKESERIRKQKPRLPTVDERHGLCERYINVREKHAGVNQFANIQIIIS